MNCNQAIEFLPWLLNSTLAEGERRTVQEHLAGCASCREALRETRFAWQVFDQHLPSEALVAIAYGEALPAGLDAGLAQRHLASCPQCAAELELVRTSRHLEEDERIVPMPVRSARPAGSRTWRSSALAAGLAGVVALAGWVNSSQRVRSLESILAEGAAPRTEAPATTPAVPPAAAPTGAGEAPDEDERIARLEAQVRRLESEKAAAARAGETAEPSTRPGQSSGPSRSEPWINVQVEDLLPNEAAERSGEGDGVKELAGDRLAALFLTAQHSPETHESHRIQILDTAGREVWSKPGLKRDGERDAYFLSLPPGFLAPGAYTIRVSAQEGGREVVTEIYRVQVD